MRTKIKHLLFALLPLLILLAALEMLFRLTGKGEPFTTTLEMWDAPLTIMQPDPYTTYRLRPNAKIGDIRLNSLGYRDNELNHDAAVKILCLGDSVTFGWGVTDPANTFSQQLEKILSSSDTPPRKTIEVFNAGVPSYQLYQGFQLYLHYLAGLEKWDYVICSFAWNENLEIETETEALELEYTQRNPPGENALLHAARQGAEKLRFYNVLESLYVRTFLAKDIHDIRYPYVRYGIMLNDFVKAVKDNNSRPILLAAQVREEDKPNRRGIAIQKLNAIAELIARQENIPYVDTDAEFMKNDSGWYDNVHFDEKGHRLTAEALSLAFTGELGSIRTQ